MTWQTQQVLLALLEAPTADHYGLELAEQAGLKSGTLYPILARFEAAGWVTGSWEQIDPKKAGRRPRRYYRLTARGVEEGEALREAMAALLSGKAAFPGLVPRIEGLTS
jgi:DNA-binding PadR family transcriptional regulator